MTVTLSTEILQKTDDIVMKLQERLKPSGWYHRLQGLLTSEDFRKIIETLVVNSYEGKRFTPVIKDLFKAFELTPFDEIKALGLHVDHIHILERLHQKYPQSFHSSPSLTIFFVSAIAAS